MNVLKKSIISIAVVSAAAISLSNTALAQGSVAVAGDALMTYHQADPFAPLPQFWTLNDRADRTEQRTGAQSSAGTDYALSTYYGSDPLGPLPQFWAIQRDSKAAGVGVNAIPQRKDVLGRPFVNLEPEQFYYQTEPFGLEPRVSQLRKGAREEAAKS